MFPSLQNRRPRSFDWKVSTFSNLNQVFSVRQHPADKSCMLPYWKQWPGGSGSFTPQTNSSCLSHVEHQIPIHSSFHVSDVLGSIPNCWKDTVAPQFSDRKSEENMLDWSSGLVWWKLSGLQSPDQTPRGWSGMVPGLGEPSRAIQHLRLLCAVIGQLCRWETIQASLFSCSAQLFLFSGNVELKVATFSSTPFEEPSVARSRNDILNVMCQVDTAEAPGQVRGASCFVLKCLVLLYKPEN